MALGSLREHRVAVFSDPNRPGADVREESGFPIKMSKFSDNPPPPS